MDRCVYLSAGVGFVFSVIALVFSIGAYDRALRSDAANLRWKANVYAQSWTVVYAGGAFDIDAYDPMKVCFVSTDTDRALVAPVLDDGASAGASLIGLLRSTLDRGNLIYCAQDGGGYDCLDATLRVGHQASFADVPLVAGRVVREAQVTLTLVYGRTVDAYGIEAFRRDQTIYAPTGISDLKLAR